MSMSKIPKNDNLKNDSLLNHKDQNKKVVTRFAPSPTGMLHIGSVRTAFFNWLHAKHHKGLFFLRIEDTDAERSTSEAIKAIKDGLNWLGIYWDGDVVLQSQNHRRHLEVVNQMLIQGKAYRCYMTEDEISKFKKNNPHQKVISHWRDKNLNDRNDISNANVTSLNKEEKYTIRLRVNYESKEKITFHDKVQGKIEIDAKELDDMVLIRSDGTATYMLASVVDDHDMGITEIIRGTDHITNTFRQMQIYKAMNWKQPEYAHIPLIHNQEGQKMSKRKGAGNILNYYKAGYLPETIKNYLIRLGWGYKNQEIFSLKEMKELFDIKDVSKSPARFDLDKLNALNLHYIKKLSSERFTEMIIKKLAEMYQLKIDDLSTNNSFRKIARSMDALKQRGQTLNEIATIAYDTFFNEEIITDNRVLKILTLEKNIVMIKELQDKLNNIEKQKWSQDNIKAEVNSFVQSKNIKLSHLMPLIRAFLLRSFASPLPIYDILFAMGKTDSLNSISRSLLMYSYYKEEA